jgi:hypothetical protein
VAEARGWFVSPAEREHSPLETVSRGLLKTMTWNVVYACVTVICKFYSGVV